MLGSRRLRLQNPALGPFITKASAHRDNPRSESGRWMAAVRRVDIDKMKATLQSISTSASHHTAAETYRSTARLFHPRLRASQPGRIVLNARGSTYKAISPLLLPFSIQMLAPQAKDPASMAPCGPSQKSCDTKGKILARTTARVRQTPYQYNATNEARKAVLRNAPRLVARKRAGRMRVLGRVKRTGTKCT